MSERSPTMILFRASLQMLTVTGHLASVPECSLRRRAFTSVRGQPDFATQSRERGDDELASRELCISRKRYRNRGGCPLVASFTPLMFRTTNGRWRLRI